MRGGGQGQGQRPQDKERENDHDETHADATLRRADTLARATKNAGLVNARGFRGKILDADPVTLVHESAGGETQRTAFPSSFLFGASKRDDITASRVYRVR